MPILTAHDLTKDYGAGSSVVHALNGVSLCVEKGEFVAVVGQSGSGKSTLLHLLGGLDRPTSGEVTVAGRDLTRMSDGQRTIFRRRNIGFVFQNYNLVPVLSVYENVVLPVELDGNAVDAAFVDGILDALGLSGLRKRMPGQLSGGQQQRAAIARALVTRPALLLADEPTGNLDSRTSQDVLGLLRTTATRFRQTMVVITHNEQVALLADRVIRVEDGRIVEGGV